MQRRCDREDSPISACERALVVDGVATVGVSDQAERGDGSEELVAYGPAQGPLAPEEARACGVVGVPRFGEVDKKGRNCHEGLCNGIS